jgi:hypothetical protein
MGVQSSAEGPHGQSSNAEAYRRRFVVEVHQLLAMGYARLEIAAIQDLEEPAITAELVEAIDAITEDRTSPDWTHRYVVYDDPPVKLSGRKGKQRPRVDIRIRRTERGKHPRFEIEAKRLRVGDKRAVSHYVGKNGLGCFISGRYARTTEDAGMLGYIMSESHAYWEERITKRLEGDRIECRMIGSWTRAKHIKDLQSCHCTIHDRDDAQKPLTVYHTLLLLKPTSSA